MGRRSMYHPPLAASCIYPLLPESSHASVLRCICTHQLYSIPKIPALRDNTLLKIHMQGALERGNLVLRCPPPPETKRHGGGCSSSEENPIKRATSAALHTTAEADRPHLAFPTRRIPNPHPYWRRGQGSCITSSGRPSSAERRHWRLQPAALQSIQKGYVWLAHIQPFYFILRCWFSVVPAQSRPL